MSDDQAVTAEPAERPLPEERECLPVLGVLLESRPEWAEYANGAGDWQPPAEPESLVAGEFDDARTALAAAVSQAFLNHGRRHARAAENMQAFYSEMAKGRLAWSAA